MTRARPVSPLEQLRRAGGWDQGSFARGCGVTPSYVAAVERGREKASPGFKAAACRLLSSRLALIAFPPETKEGRPA
jgi:transcriptional regulator with XRE-family HTH domain